MKTITNRGEKKVEKENNLDFTESIEHEKFWSLYIS